VTLFPCVDSDAHTSAVFSLLDQMFYFVWILVAIISLASGRPAWWCCPVILVGIWLFYQVRNLYSGHLTGCCRNRYITFVKTAAYQFQQLRLKKMAEEHGLEQVWSFSMLFLVLIYAVFMPSSTDCIHEGMIFLGCPSPRSSIHLDRSCYHDVSWTAWTVSMNHTGNVQ